MQCGLICDNKNKSLCLITKVDRHFTLTRHRRHVFDLGFLLPAPWQSMHKTCVIYSIINCFIGIVSKAIIKYSYEVGKLSNKVMTMFFSHMSTSKYVSWYASTLTLLTWSNKLSSSCILYMKHLWYSQRMLDNFFMLWMLQIILYASTCPLELLMCASWLSTKLRLMMDMTFFMRLWYSFNTLGSSLKGRPFSYPSAIFQRFMNVKTISILSFQRLKAYLWNFYMTLTPSLSRYTIFRSKNGFIYSTIQTRPHCS